MRNSGSLCRGAAVAVLLAAAPAAAQFESTQQECTGSYYTWDQQTWAFGNLFSIPGFAQANSYLYWMYSAPGPYVGTSPVTTSSAATYPNLMYFQFGYVYPTVIFVSPTGGCGDDPGVQQPPEEYIPPERTPWSPEDPVVNEVPDDDGLDDQVTGTPEPISLLLLGTGLAGVGGAWARKRKQRNTPQ